MELIIGAAQSRSAAGDVLQNALRHLRIAETAAEHGVQLLVFPELSLTGYELALARECAVLADSSELRRLRDLAREARMTVVAGAPVQNDEGELHIGALALRPDGSVVTYTKVHVHESEARVFTRGVGGPLLAVEGGRIALAICADASHPEHAASAAARGANVYAAGVMITAEAVIRKSSLLTSYASEHGMAVLMANYSGRTGGEVSAGKSAVWSEDGQAVAASTGNEEALVIGRKRDGVWEGMVLTL